MSEKWPKKRPENIIVRLPNWLGDAVMATPVLQDLRTAFADASITAMCQSTVAPLLEHDPHIDEIFSYKRPSGWIHRQQHLKILQPLRKGGFDLGLLLTNSFSSAWWFFRGNVKNTIGFSGPFRRFILDKAVPFPKEKEFQHQVVTYKELLRPLGIAPSDTPPKLYLMEQEILAAKEMLKKYRIEVGRGTIYGINPGAAYGSAKCWLPERFQEVAKRLVALPNTYVLFFGDAASAPLVNMICQGFQERVINLAGKTNLRELMALIACCSALLTNDSGPMHIAAALDVPLLALFGSTSDVKTGPFPKGRVINKRAGCSPCYKRVCPIDFRCMKQIEADEVFRELVEVVKESEQTTSL